MVLISDTIAKQDSSSEQNIAGLSRCMHASVCSHHDDYSNKGLPSRSADKISKPTIFTSPRTVVVTADVFWIISECMTLYDSATMLLQRSTSSTAVLFCV